MKMDYIHELVTYFMMKFHWLRTLVLLILIVENAYWNIQSNIINFQNQGIWKSENIMIIIFSVESLNSGFWFWPTSLFALFHAVYYIVYNMYWDYIHSSQQNTERFGAVWCKRLMHCYKLYMSVFANTTSSCQLLKTHLSVFKKIYKMSSENYSLMLQMIKSCLVPMNHKCPLLQTFIPPYLKLSVFVAVSAIDCYKFPNQILILLPPFTIKHNKHVAFYRKNVQISAPLPLWYVLFGAAAIPNCTTLALCAFIYRGGYWEQSRRIHSEHGQLHSTLYTRRGSEAV